MAVEIPTYQQIINSIRADISYYLPDVDPTIHGSFIKALADSLAGRIYDLTLLFNQLEKEMFPQSASGEYLERWANYEALTRNPATVANGPILITGNDTTVIPSGTELLTSDGRLYATDEELTLSERSVTLTSLTRSGYIVTGTSPTSHNLASNIEATIAGAEQTEYNGSHTITVLSTTTFSYTIETLPTTPADTTSSLVISYIGGVVDVTSDDTGEDQNIGSGGTMSITSPIAGADNDAYVTFDEIDGGTDEETDSDLLVRVLQSRSSPVANFNVGAIEKVARSVAGVTRVFVKETTPDVGDVTIYFVRDNEDNIIPTTTDVENVETAILAIKPATTSDSSVIVSAPTPVETDYTFSAINPDTSTMRTAIESNLEAFYAEGVTFEENITEDKYRSAIVDTVDPDTGDILLSFTLSTPTTDITISTGEIGVLGTVSFT